MGRAVVNFLTRVGLVGGLAVLAPLMVGCGGGGGGGAAPTATSAPSTATPIPPTATAPPPPSFTHPPVPTATIAPTDTPEDTVAPAPSDTPTQTEEPTSTLTPTATPLIGPVVTAFGLAENTGTFNSPIGTDDAGRPIYRRGAGDGFVIFVEARTGVSGLPIATNLLSTLHDDPSGQPDLQILSSQPLGNGSAEVCDRNFPTAGGIPAIDPPQFDFLQPISNALNDFACRFRIFTEPDFACTQDNNNNLAFANQSSVLQFCTLVNKSFTFPAGDTILTVRVRDTGGKAGPPAQIVVRIGG